MKKTAAVLMSCGIASAGLLAPLTTATASAAQKVTISYMLWDQNQVPAIDKIVTAFEAKYPDIQVKVVLTPWAQYWTKLQAGAQGGNLPDVFWINPSNFQMYASNGMLMPLTSEVKSGKINLSNYPKATTTPYIYKNVPYAVPSQFDAVGLWYNKALFQAAHVSFPNASWTWASVISAAKKLSDKSKGVWGIAAAEGDQENYFDTIYQNGGQVISTNKKKSGYDTPASIGGLQYWTNFINKYHVSPTLQQMTDTTPLQLFESGKVAMLYGGSWHAVELSQIPYMAKNADVTVLPKGKKRATITNPLGNVIAHNTPYPTQAKEFVDFLGTKKASQLLAGAVIPSFNGTQQIWVKSIPEFHLQSFLDEMKYAVPLPTSKETSNWRNLEPQYLNPAWTGSESIQLAATQLAQAMNSQLALEH